MVSIHSTAPPPGRSSFRQAAVYCCVPQTDWPRRLLLPTGKTINNVELWTFSHHTPWTHRNTPLLCTRTVCLCLYKTIFLIFAFLHGLFWYVIVLTCKILRSQAPSFLEELIASCKPTRLLSSPLPLSLKNLKTTLMEQTLQVEAEPCACSCRGSRSSTVLFSFKKHVSSSLGRVMYRWQ